MSFTESNGEKKSEKEDYQIMLSNSDLLDTDFKNTEKHAQKIASLYYKFLVRNINPFNVKNIIVRIEHRSLKIQNFEYSEENIKQLSSTGS